MDLNRVTAFVHVVRDGTFTGAARALGVPKSSVSRSVAQLEADLGVRLLHRTTRRLRLTDAGASFYAHAAKALDDLAGATAAARETHGELEGTVRVTAPVDFGAWVLGAIVARFVRKNPRIRIDVSLTSRVVDLVGEGFDLALRAGPMQDSSLVVRRVGSLRSALFASPSYLARHGVPEDAAALGKHAFVLFRGKDGRATLSLERAGAPVQVGVRGVTSADDLTFVRRAVLAGAGIGLVPEFLVGREEARGRVVRVLADLAAPGAPVHVAYPSARLVPQRVVVFREFLVRGVLAFTERCRARSSAGVTAA